MTCPRPRKYLVSTNGMDILKDTLAEANKLYDYWVGHKLKVTIREIIIVSAVRKSDA